jgi:hypothetical protein
VDQVLASYQVSGYCWEVIVDLFNSNASVLLQNIKAHFNDLLRRETAEIQAGIKKLNNYFLSYWIGKITPEVFSVFGLSIRTKNFVESWQRWLNERMGTSHLNPFLRSIGFSL